LLLFGPGGEDRHGNIHSFIVHFGYKYRRKLGTGRH
jgi:hypothetical protein